MKTTNLLTGFLLALLLAWPWPAGAEQQEQPEQQEEQVYEEGFSLVDYLAMRDATGGGALVTVGWDGSEGRMLSVFDWYAFFDGGVVDVGMGGNAFSYRSTSRASSYSLFGFGPLLRIGRLMVHGQFHLLSFQSVEGDDTWHPGFVARANLPLVHMDGEWSSLLFLVPMPSVGVEWWFDSKLHHHETLFWFGLAWPGGVGLD
jgi:hypothetical protein